VHGVRAARDVHRGAVRDALAAHALKPTVNDVIAVDVADEGEVIVYIRK
jgi:hypothetical protein